MCLQGGTSAIPERAIQKTIQLQAYSHRDGGGAADCVTTIYTHLDVHRSEAIITE